MFVPIFRDDFSHLMFEKVIPNHAPSLTTPLIFLAHAVKSFLQEPCLHLSFQVNFLSYVALATAALPTLEKNGGALVVVSSLTGWWLYLE